MPRKEFSGDPRRASDVVPYVPATSAPEGGIYYVTAFASSMGALLFKTKWVGWVAIFSALLCSFNDRVSATGSASGRLSTITLALTALMITYMPELITVYRAFNGTEASVST
ncbi:hypothetical protein J3B02_004462 [Coemansia erecta]|uniref:Uncharacterized protein n=1 Tax=Coemansia asiatica TaxID=1052880 RepID=A0A9W8CKC3_9FUNG|nr:hypothetical protein LPJ64_001710 [Coemansia asiatica]KAJ2846228.1 hypothetical protein J3B02_004462 [Coemansia erecta]